MRVNRLGWAVVAVAVALMSGCASTPQAGDASNAVESSSRRPTRPAFGSEPTTSVFGGVLAGDALQSEVLVRKAGKYLEIGRRADGRLVVGLRANERASADELVSAYGDRLALRLGFLPYPDANARLPNARPPCGDAVLPGTAKKEATLSWRSTPTAFVVKSGERFEGVITFTNGSSKDIAFESGDVTSGLVTRANDERIVARNDIEIAGIGKGGVLKPGESASVRMVSSTASCDPGLRWILPAGRYELKVSFDRFVSTPFPVTVVQ